MVVLIQRMKIKEMKHSAHTASRSGRSFMIIKNTIWILISSGSSSGMSGGGRPLLPHNGQTPGFGASIMTKWKEREREIVCYMALEKRMK